MWDLAPPESGYRERIIELAKRYELPIETVDQIYTQGFCEGVERCRPPRERKPRA